MKEEKDNLVIYNQIRSVPSEAQKKITGGRLNGMTDIKPMWRIEKLTELFGMCGFGWFTKIKNKEIIDGANGEKIAIVDIDLFVKDENGNWSEGIEGTGGSSFISNESKGLYTSDECFKMAYTDALSVACKALGMGADVYWGDSKYSKTQEEKKEMTKEEAEKYKLTFGKYAGKTLIEVADINESYIDYLLDNSTDDDVLDAINLIWGDNKRYEPSDEILGATNRLMMLVAENDVDLESIKTLYNVKDLKKADLPTLTSMINKVIEIGSKNIGE